MLPDFHYGNLATIPNTFGKHWSRPHPFWNQTSKPDTFKALKASANSSFSTPMSKNYDFTKIKDYLQTGIVGCLTLSPHVTRLPNSRTKILCPSILD